MSENFVPVALNRFLQNDREFLRSLQRQKDQYQGLWIVAPDGTVLASHKKATDSKAWPQELLATLETSLKTFGEVQPRQAKPTDNLPHRGVGVQADGSVSLALHVRCLHWIAQAPRADSPVVFDTLTLSQKEWATLAPARAVADSEWTVPETIARKFSRALSPSSDQGVMVVPGDVTAVRISGQVQNVANGVAYLVYEGEIAASGLQEGDKNKLIGGEANLSGVGAYDLEARHMLSLTLIFEGNYYTGVPPPVNDNLRRPSGAALEWRREQDDTKTEPTARALKQ